MKKLLLIFGISIHLINISLFAQNHTRTVSGWVVDDRNHPVIFASVKAKNLALYAITDIDGKFAIRIPDTCSILEFHYTGYVPLEINITGQDSIHVVMKGGIVLDAVVVTEYKVPLIEMDNTTTGQIKTAGQVRNLPAKNGRSRSNRHAGFSDQNLGVNIIGSRTNAASYAVSGLSTTGGFNTEDYDNINENIFHSTETTPLSTFSIDVDAASYSNMRRYLNAGHMPPKDAIRIEELVNYFDYDYPQPEGDYPFAIVSEVSVCPWNTEHKLVHIGLQGKEISAEDLPASNLVFLLDVSGSMNQPNKLPLVISSFKILTEHLRAKDRVAIVVYAGSSGLVLPSTPGNRKDEIYAALDKLYAGGSTAGAAGIKLAYTIARQHFIKDGNNRVILATDGDFNVGVSSDGELVEIIEKERENDIFLTVLGFGMGNYKDNKMQKLADHGNGNHGYVDDIAEARKVFVHEFGGTLFTIAKDVKIQVEFNPSAVAAYRLIGYENRLLEAEDFNDDLKDAGEIGSGHSVTALYEIIPVGVQSTALKSVDDLKYQKVKRVKENSLNDELMTIKFRYKAPDGDVSQLIEKVIKDEEVPFLSTSINYRWSSAVALFGMLLRESEFVKKSNVTDVESWASAAVGEDENGYRSEFLRLVRGIGPELKSLKR